MRRSPSPLPAHTVTSWLSRWNQSYLLLSPHLDAGSPTLLLAEATFQPAGAC